MNFADKDYLTKLIFEKEGTRMEDRKKCGNCTWHIPSGGEWICSCEDSEAYGLETEYSDSCEEFHDSEY